MLAFKLQKIAAENVLKTPTLIAIILLIIGIFLSIFKKEAKKTDGKQIVRFDKDQEK